MSISKVVENSYQWGEEKTLTRAELERLEAVYWKQATNYASEGMYSNAAGCKTKAQFVHDLLIGYKWEE